MTTRTEAAEDEHRALELAYRRQRECPLEGPNSIISGVVRQALTDGNLDQAQAVLDQAADTDYSQAETETIVLIERIAGVMKEQGFELNDEQKAALIIAGPEIYLEGLYHGRAEGASVLQDMQQGQGE